jgi:hypothetical protein
VHVRLLLALPLLVVAELVVHRRMRPVVAQFVDRGLIPESEVPRFHEAVASAMRLRNAIWVEALLITVVYVVGVGIVQLGVTTVTPVLPLMLTMISLEELLTKLLQIIF